MVKLEFLTFDRFHIMQTSREQSLIRRTSHFPLLLVPRGKNRNIDLWSLSNLADFQEKNAHLYIRFFIADGLYRNAAHYFQVHSNQLVDQFATSKRIVFPTKLKVATTKQLGDVLSLTSQDYYVNIKGFQRECVTDLNVCQKGLSVAFWLQMFDGKYIISGGRYRGKV